MKKIIALLFSISLFILILLYPEVALQGANEGVSLWAAAVLPALMPFSIAMGLLQACGLSTLIGSLLSPLSKKIFGFDGEFMYAFFSASFSGYPMGAKITANLYKDGKIKKDQAIAMVKATSVTGPLFLVNTVATKLLNTPTASPYLLFPHYLSAIIMAIFAGLPFRKQKNKFVNPLPAFIYNNPLSGQNFGAILGKIIADAMQNMLLICGYMIVFNVYIQLIAHLIAGTFLSEFTIILGMLEITTGCNIVSTLPLSVALILSNAFIGFGGMSIGSQTKAIAGAASIEVKGLFLYKSIQGVLAALICWLQQKIIPLDTITVSTITSSNPIQIDKIILLFAALLCFIACFIKKQKKQPN